MIFLKILIGLIIIVTVFRAKSIAATVFLKAKNKQRYNIELRKLFGYAMLVALEFSVIFIISKSFSRQDLYDLSIIYMFALFSIVMVKIRATKIYNKS